MPRLRKALVEYKVCTCGFEYEADQCPGCPQHRLFDATAMRKVAYDRLIVVESVPPGYERREHLRCKRRGLHYLVMNQVLPPGNLKEAWDNLYDVDLADLELLSAAQEVLEDPLKVQDAAAAAG